MSRTFAFYFMNPFLWTWKEHFAIVCLPKFPYDWLGILIYKVNCWYTWIVSSAQPAKWPQQSIAWLSWTVHPDVLTFNCFVPMHTLRGLSRRCRRGKALRLSDSGSSSGLCLESDPFPFLVFHVPVAVFLPERRCVVGRTFPSYSAGPRFESRSRDLVNYELDDRGSIPGRSKDISLHHRCDQTGWVPSSVLSSHYPRPWRPWSFA